MEWSPFLPIIISRERPPYMHIIMVIEGSPFLPIIMARDASISAYYNGYRGASFPA
jgi:hypothetical protein